MTPPPPRKIVMIPESRLALQRELRNHPSLLEKLQIYHQDDFEGILGEIAAHVNVLLDDYYTQDDIDRICDMLVFRLKQKGMEIIL